METRLARGSAVEEDLRWSTVDRFTLAVLEEAGSRCRQEVCREERRQKVYRQQWLSMQNQKERGIVGKICK